MDIRKSGAILGAILLLIVLAIFVFQYLNAPPNLGGIGANAPAPDKTPEKPAVHFYTKGKGIVVSWSNLPAGTTELDILRSLVGKNDFVKWKTVSISGNAASGTAEFTLGSGEMAEQYVFKAQATSGGSPASASSSTQATGGSTAGQPGEVLWASESATAEPFVAVSGQPAPGQSVPQESQTQAGNEPPGDSSASSPEPGTHTTPAPSQAPSQPQGQQDASIVYYYSPNGNISSTSSITLTAPFNVLYSDNTIEISWNGIVAADEIVISRAPSAGGPWSELLKQEDPLATYMIRIVDNTLDQLVPYYYKLDVLTAGAVSATYGPVTLTPRE